jgi:pyruvate dehydrogenase (quinone)/pyruvate oxidase
MGPAHVENVTHLACRTALAGRGVAHINFPVDFQDEKLKEAHRSKRNIPGHTVDVFARSAGMPAGEDLARAADVLNAGKKVAILAGRGALDAGAELEELAEKLGAPTVKALLGKAAVPDLSPYTTGGVGLLGTGPSGDAMKECDTLFIVGSSFPYIEYYPKPGSAKGVQLDVDAGRIGLRYPVDVGLVGDTRQTLRQILPMIRRNEDRSFLKKAQDGMQDWWKLMEERGTRKDKPMKPQVPAWELNKLLRDDAIVVSDSGTITTWFARQIQARKGQMYSLSGTLATMACGLPYALAAQIAHPGRQVVAMVGDGGFSMLMADFATAVKYKLPVKIIVYKNNALEQIKWEQMVFLGNPEFGCELHPIDFPAVARACGGAGFTVDDPDMAGSVLRMALETEGPALVEVVVDPNTPPMPGNIKAGQAIHFAEALARGTPGRKAIIADVIKDRARELV